MASFPDHEFLGEEDVAPGKDASAAALDAKLSSSKDSWLWIVGTYSTCYEMCMHVSSHAATSAWKVVLSLT